MKKYNLGIIGAGMYGKVLMRWLQQDERANINWVNSASEATTKAAVEAAPEQIVLEASCRHTRLTRKFQFIKELIDGGKLGEIYHIHRKPSQ